MSPKPVAAWACDVCDSCGLLPFLLVAVALAGLSAYRFGPAPAGEPTPSPRELSAGLVAVVLSFVSLSALTMAGYAVIVVYPLAAVAVPAVTAGVAGRRPIRATLLANAVFGVLLLATARAAGGK